MHRAARVISVVAGWLGYAVLVVDLNSLDDGSRSAKLIFAACLVCATLTVGVDLGVRPTFDSPERRAAYRSALRTGRLPATIDPYAWRGWLRRNRLSNAMTLWSVFPLLFGLASSLSSASAYRSTSGWAFALLAIGCTVAGSRANMRITRLEAEVARHCEMQVRVAAKPDESWVRTTPAVRVVSMAVTGFAIAFLTLLVSDLDSVVYGGSGTARLGRAASWAAVMALTSAAAVFWDPSSRRTSGSIERLIEYERALRTGELPAVVETDVWRRWLKSSRWFYGLGLWWGCFFVVAGASAIATNPSGYHWVVASLLQLLAIRLVLSWWGWRARIARLTLEVERHGVRQSWR